MKLFTLPDVPKSLLWRIFIGMFTFASFAAFSLLVGGDALNGKIENGHYYVAGGTPYKEVTFSVYVTSTVLCLASSIGIFLGGNSVLRLLDMANLVDPRKILRPVLNVFLGFICGCIAIYALATLWQAFSQS
jgi:hypothetical protein